MTTLTQVKERPILFSGEMVRAILEGRKTQTRRVVTHRRFFDVVETEMMSCSDNGVFGYWPILLAKDGGTEVMKCPYGVPGDRLWVRETWFSRPSSNEFLGYSADGDYPHGKAYRVRPSIHMPRWASRILLEITDIRVERVQDISEADAEAEGMPCDLDFPISEAYCPNCLGQGLHGAFGENYGMTEVECSDCETVGKRFRNLWDSINEKRGFGWNTNPWVWVVEFKVINEKGETP